MMPTMRTHLQPRLQLSMKNHLLAAGTLMPKIIRHLGTAKQGTDLWADKFCEPGHEEELAGFGGEGKF